MNRLGSVALLTALLAGSAGLCLAGDLSTGKVVEHGTASRGAMEQFDGLGTGGAGPARSGDTSMRAMPDEQMRIKAFGMIKRSRDGTVIQMEAPAAVVDAIRGRQKSDSGISGGAAEQKAEASREVHGADAREKVPDTTAYPFDTVGFIEATSKGLDKPRDCTGALIGPRLVITAAQCIYDHDIDGGWVDEVKFWPGINGKDDIPYGSYKWTDSYVLNGYVTEYDGTYESVWAYDMALIVLDDNAGNDLGWLGYGVMDTEKDVIVNLIGYQSDKEAFTQWRTDCTVKPGDIRDYDFSHDCDSDAWSTGAPMYLYDSKADTRQVVGLHIGPYGDVNWAIKIDEPVADWIDSINQ